jgi:hypothetical protein
MTSTTAATTATTERRARPRHTPACRADRCSQGRHACPCPQACELPEEKPGTTLEVAAFCAVITVAILGLCVLVALGAGA